MSEPHLPPPQHYIAAAVVESNGAYALVTPGATTLSPFDCSLCVVKVENQTSGSLDLKLQPNVRGVAEGCAIEAEVADVPPGSDYRGIWSVLTNEVDSVDVYVADQLLASLVVNQYANLVEISAAGAITTRGQGFVDGVYCTAGILRVDNHSSANYSLHFDEGGPALQLSPGLNIVSVASSQGLSISSASSSGDATHLWVAHCNQSVTTMLPLQSGTETKTISIPWAIAPDENGRVRVVNSGPVAVCVWREGDSGNAVPIAPRESHEFEFPLDASAQWALHWETDDDPKVIVKKDDCGGSPPGDPPGGDVSSSQAGDPSPRADSAVAPQHVDKKEFYAADLVWNDAKKQFELVRFDPERPFWAPLAVVKVGLRGSSDDDFGPVVMTLQPRHRGAAIGLPAAKRFAKPGAGVWSFVDDDVDSIAVEVDYERDGVRARETFELPIRSCASRISIDAAGTITSASGSVSLFCPNGVAYVANASPNSYFLRRDEGGPSVEIPPASTRAIGVAGCRGLALHERGDAERGTHLWVFDTSSSTVRIVLNPANATELLSLPYAITARRNGTVTLVNGTRESLEVWTVGRTRSEAIAVAPGQSQDIRFDPDAGQWGLRWLLGSQPEDAKSARIVVRRPI